MNFHWLLQSGSEPHLRAWNNQKRDSSQGNEYFWFPSSTFGEVSPVGCPWPTWERPRPRRFIAFDNSKYAVVELEEKNKSETTKLFDIQTGIGGYIPRYIADSMGKKAKP